MKAELVKRQDRWDLYGEDGSKIASSTPNPIGKLSIKNFEAIANGYDLDELADEYYKRLELVPHKGNAYISGFQKALEILGDKKFSEDDMIKFMQFTISIEELGNTSSVSKSTAKYYLDNFTSNLQQTEWDVEIEMECPQCQEWGYISECRNNCNNKFLHPKLDADGCLILKRIDYGSI